MDEDVKDEVMPHWPQMKVDNLVVTTTKERICIYDVCYNMSEENTLKNCRR
jgi:hypothetical protein